MMRKILNTMRREAERAASTKSFPRRGVVSAYDPQRYAAKVLIQPEGFETGWLPIGSSWVGRLWGMFSPPTPGDEVEVNFQEGGKNAGYIGARFFGNNARPLAVPAGEFWLVHASGSMIKLDTDGRVVLADKSSAYLILNGDGTASLGADLTVFGNIIAAGNISDQSGTNGTVQHIRDVYDTHTHSGVQGGPGSTAVPNQLL